jgi:hypothetical protein
MNVYPDHVQVNYFFWTFTAPRVLHFTLRNVRDKIFIIIRIRRLCHEIQGHSLAQDFHCADLAVEFPGKRTRLITFDFLQVETGVHPDRTSLAGRPGRSGPPAAVS